MYCIVIFKAFAISLEFFLLNHFNKGLIKVVQTLPTLKGTNLLNSNSPTTRVLRYSEFQLLTFLPTHLQSTVVQSAASSVTPWEPRHHGQTDRRQTTLNWTHVTVNSLSNAFTIYSSHGLHPPTSQPSRMFLSTRLPHFIEHKFAMEW